MELLDVDGVEKIKNDPEFIRLKDRLESLSKEEDILFKELGEKFPTVKDVTWGLSASHTLRLWLLDSTE